MEFITPIAERQSMPRMIYVLLDAYLRSLYSKMFRHVASLLHYNCGCYTKEGHHDTYKAGTPFKFANVFRLIFCKACYKNN